MSNQLQASPKKSDAKAGGKLNSSQRQSRKVSPINTSNAPSQFENADKQAVEKETAPPVDIGYVTFFPSAQEHEQTQQQAQQQTTDSNSNPQEKGKNKQTVILVGGASADQTEGQPTPKVFGKSQNTSLEANQPVPGQGSNTFGEPSSAWPVINNGDRKPGEQQTTINGLNNSKHKQSGKKSLNVQQDGSIRSASDTRPAGAQGQVMQGPQLGQPRFFGPSNDNLIKQNGSDQQSTSGQLTPEKINKRKKQRSDHTGSDMLATQPSSNPTLSQGGPTTALDLRSHHQLNLGNHQQSHVAPVGPTGLKYNKGQNISILSHHKSGVAEGQNGLNARSISSNSQEPTNSQTNQGMPQKSTDTQNKPKLEVADNAERAAQKIINSNVAVAFKQSKNTTIESKGSSGKHTPVRPSHNILKKGHDGPTVQGSATASLEANTVEDYKSMATKGQRKGAHGGQQIYHPDLKQDSKGFNGTKPSTSSNLVDPSGGNQQLRVTKRLQRKGTSEADKQRSSHYQRMHDAAMATGNTNRQNQALHVQDQLVMAQNGINQLSVKQKETLTNASSVSENHSPSKPKKKLTQQNVQDTTKQQINGPSAPLPSDQFQSVFSPKSPGRRKRIKNAIQGDLITSNQTAGASPNPLGQGGLNSNCSSVNNSVISMNMQSGNGNNAAPSAQQESNHRRKVSNIDFNQHTPLLSKQPENLKQFNTQQKQTLGTNQQVPQDYMQQTGFETIQGNVSLHNASSPNQQRKIKRYQDQFAPAQTNASVDSHLGSNGANGHHPSQLRQITKQIQKDQKHQANGQGAPSTLSHEKFSGQSRLPPMSEFGSGSVNEDYVKQYATGTINMNDPSSNSAAKGRGQVSSIGGQSEKEALTSPQVRFKDSNSRSGAQQAMDFKDLQIFNTRQFDSFLSDGIVEGQMPDGQGNINRSTSGHRHQAHHHIGSGLQHPQQSGVMTPPPMNSGQFSGQGNQQLPPSQGHPYSYTPIGGQVVNPNSLVSDQVNQDQQLKMYINQMSGLHQPQIVSYSNRVARMNPQSNQNQIDLSTVTTQQQVNMIQKYSAATPQIHHAAQAHDLHAGYHNSHINISSRGGMSNGGLGTPITSILSEGPDAHQQRAIFSPRTHVNASNMSIHSGGQVMNSVGNTSGPGNQNNGRLTMGLDSRQSNVIRKDSIGGRQNVTSGGSNTAATTGVSNGVVGNQSNATSNHQQIMQIEQQFSQATAIGGFPGTMSPQEGARRSGSINPRRQNPVVKQQISKQRAGGAAMVLPDCFLQNQAGSLTKVQGSNGVSSANKTSRNNAHLPAYMGQEPRANQTLSPKQMGDTKLQGANQYSTVIEEMRKGAAAASENHEGPLNIVTPERRMTTIDHGDERQNIKQQQTHQTPKF